MRKKIDVTIGQRYGRWTVLEDLGGKQYRKLLCRCDCGTQRVHMTYSHKKQIKPQNACITWALSSIENIQTRWRNRFLDHMVILVSRTEVN